VAYEYNCNKNGLVEKITPFKPNAATVVIMRGNKIKKTLISLMIAVLVISCNGKGSEKVDDGIVEAGLKWLSGKLPVTAHTSPLGMTIADGHNFILNDREKQLAADNRDVIAFTSGAISLRNPDVKESVLYVDKIATHPDHWRRVLEYNNGELSKLKLCLAHFSGKDVWLKKSPDPLWDWRQSVCGLINGFENVYTDISCYTFSLGDLWILTGEDYEKIKPPVCTAEEQRIMRNAYTFEPHERYYYLSCPESERLLVRAIAKKCGLIQNNVSLVAKKLAETIRTNPKLRWRILMGSDWYMAELENSSVGEYYINMFDLLRTVTGELKEMGAGEWDAWHQFSVVNPLIFLGLIEKPDGSDSPAEETDAGTGRKYYKLDTARLKKAYANAKSKVTDPNWAVSSKISQQSNTDDFEETPDLEKLQNSVIYAADSMKKDGVLLVLNEADEGQPPHA
jgi:hypothetical protein